MHIKKIIIIIFDAKVVDSQSIIAEDEKCEWDFTEKMDYEEDFEDVFTEESLPTTTTRASVAPKVQVISASNEGVLQWLPYYQLPTFHGQDIAN